MFSLVQMHQMVQPQLDFAGPHQASIETGYFSHPHGSQLPRPSLSQQSADSTPRAFAIRSAHHVPALQRITTKFARLHAHDQVEHSLRRKTPSGTIDNGYDGSLAHMASNPPPLKHMIVPASSRMFPTAVAQRVALPPASALSHHQAAAGDWQYSAATHTAKFDIGSEALKVSSAASRGWGVGPSNVVNPGAADGATFPQPLAQHNYHAAPGLPQPLLRPEYQQPLTQTVYSPGGYQQPAAWGDGSFGYRTSIPLANGYTPQNSVDGAFMPSRSMIHPGLANAPGLGQAHHFGLPLPSYPVDDGFARYGQNQSHPQHCASLFGRLKPAASYPSSVAANGELDSPARFIERALRSAHKSYNDLLLYLTNTKKAGHGRSGSLSRPSSKMVVYPKPSTAPTGSGSKVRSIPLPVGITTNYSQQVTLQEAAILTPVDGQITGRESVVTADMLSGPGQLRTPYSSPPWLYHDLGSPVSNAKASLDILSHLCEQSGWKWIEGMLLGGCLHYGLEHYEKALEWFSRIVNLDARLISLSICPPSLPIRCQPSRLFPTETTVH